MCLQGYFLASFLYLGIVFSLPVCMGLATLAFDLPVSNDEALGGLVLPAAAYVILGKAGEPALPAGAPSTIQSRESLYGAIVHTGKGWEAVFHVPRAYINVSDRYPISDFRQREAPHTSGSIQTPRGPMPPCPCPCPCLHTLQCIFWVTVHAGLVVM